MCCSVSFCNGRLMSALLITVFGDAIYLLATLASRSLIPLRKVEIAKFMSKDRSCVCSQHNNL